MINTKHELLCTPGSQPCKSRLVGIVGIAGSVSMLAGTIYALIVYPGGFNVLNQFISDLGRASDYIGANIFNASVMIGAVFMLLVGVMFSVSMTNQAAALLCMLSSIVAGIGVFLVGAFPTDVDWFLHRVAAAISFVGLTATAILLAVVLVSQDKPPVVKMLTMFLLVSLACNVMLLLHAGSGFIDGSMFTEVSTAHDIYWPAVLEWFSIYSFIAWRLAVSMHEVS